MHIWSLPLFACYAGAAVASSVNLFVSSYNGSITTLSLTQAKSGDYSLIATATNGGCAPNPSWLTLDYQNRLLFCLDEGLTVPTGSLSSYAINVDGSLTQMQKEATPDGPVSGAIYTTAGGERAIALAHYTGSALSAWELMPVRNGPFSFIESIPFKLTKPGVNPTRQDAPHEHEAILDPTKQYLLMPDLGADLVRVFSFNDNATLNVLEPLSVVPGSGPRHAAFYIPGGKATATSPTFLFVVTELGNTITSYEVTYLPNKGGLSFKQVYESNTYGNKTLPVGNAAAEVAISPDNRFLVVSNRNDSSFLIDNPNSNNMTKVRSDTMSTFKLKKDGSLKLVQLSPAGGSYPRQFAMNALGDLVAIGLQYSSEVVIYKRNITTGRMGDVAASIPVFGNITCVRWDEETFDGTYANP